MSEKEGCWWAGGPADRQVLEFLNKAPHTMGPIENEEDFAAALVFYGLVEQGLASSINFGNGNVQYCITDAGRQALAETASS